MSARPPCLGLLADANFEGGLSGVVKHPEGVECFDDVSYALPGLSKWAPPDRLVLVRLEACQSRVPVFIESMLEEASSSSISALDLVARAYSAGQHQFLRRQTHPSRSPECRLLLHPCASPHQHPV